MPPLLSDLGQDGSSYDEDDGPRSATSPRTAWIPPRTTAGNEFGAGTDQQESPFPRRPTTAPAEAEWVAGAVSQGLAQDEAESITRAALIERYSTAKECR